VETRLALLAAAAAVCCLLLSHPSILSFCPCFRVVQKAPRPQTFPAISTTHNKKFLQLLIMTDASIFILGNLISFKKRSRTHKLMMHVA
jgi:hypothetical protein